MPAETPDGIEIRWAEPGDRAAIAELVRQTKRHYGETPVPAADIEAAAAGWLQPKPGRALFVVALRDSVPAGYASAAVTPPGMGLFAALYLKELFVSDAMRGLGIGRHILAFLAEFCLAEKIERIDLTTAIDNEAGIRFYEREGAALQTRKVSLRFEIASLKKLAAGRKQAD